MCGWEPAAEPCPKPKKAEHFCSAREFPGRVLLSRDAYGHSTIGAEGLNCRVRDGNGCFTFAMATGNSCRHACAGSGMIFSPTNHEQSGNFFTETPRSRLPQESLAPSERCALPGSS